MALPVSFVNYTVGDNTLQKNGVPEKTQIRLPIVTLTAGNVVASQTLVLDLLTALNAIILGNPLRQGLIFDEHLLSTDPASTALAQRENKWLFRWHDNTTQQKGQYSLGTADLSLLTGHSEFLPVTADEGLDLKIAWEAVVKSAYDSSHASVLDSIQFVGRST